MYKIYFVLVIFALIWTAACGGGSPANTNTANNTAPKSNAVTAPIANSPAGTSTKPVAETTNNAPNLGAVIQAYYDALKKKDDAAVRATMSADFIKRTEQDMKDEKKTGMAAFMAELDTVPDKPLEVRNEKIEGDKGVCEVRGGSYLVWTPFAFVNEGGKWKLTGGSPEIDSVKQQNTSGK